MGHQGFLLCIYCKKLDTIQHHLYECKESMKLWTKIGDWIHEKLQVKFRFTVCEVIFGLPLTEYPLSVCLSVCM